MTPDQINIANAWVRTFIKRRLPHKIHDTHFFDDLSQETMLVILEGKATYYMFAVKKAARQLGYCNSCKEMTNNAGITGTDQHNPSGEYVEQSEIDDWVASVESETLELLTQGFTQEEIANTLGTSQSAVSLEVIKLREKAREDFNVN